MHLRLENWLRCASDPSSLHAFLAMDFVVYADHTLLADATAAVGASAYSVMVRMDVAFHDPSNM